jgi:hypothetical protein
MVPVLIILAAPAVRAGEWVNATGNLTNMASECGNLCRIFPVPKENKVIAGVAGAGLWASTDAGSTWTRIGGEAKIRNRPQQLLFDPADPKIFWEVGIYTAPGIFKTTDGGQTFVPLGGIGHNDGLAIDFGDPQRRIMIATGHEMVRKVFKSTNGGASFAEIGGNFPADTKHTSACYLLDAQTYLVTCAGWANGQAGIWRTADGGTSWTRVCDQMPVGPGLRTAKGVFFWGSNNGGRLLKGSNNGTTWSVVPAPGAKAINPIELPGGQLAILGSKGIMISADEGATWNTIAPPVPEPNAYHVAGGLAYNAVGGAFYTWFWDCEKVVRPDAIWRYDLPPEAVK